MKAVIVLVALALIALAYAQLSALIRVSDGHYIVCGLFKGGVICESAHRIFWSEIAAILLLTQAAWLLALGKYRFTSLPRLDESAGDIQPIIPRPSSEA